MTRFLSTPSARRATRLRRGHPGYGRISIHALREEGDRRCRSLLRLWNHFYPRPPRGGRRVIDGNNAVSYEISIHALREEGDRLSFMQKTPMRAFLSTPSARRATCRLVRIAVDIRDFYPRPPRGGRRIRQPFICVYVRFLSTPSARRATRHREALILHAVISIHALREEGDSGLSASARRIRHFYPRPPRGGRP